MIEGLQSMTGVLFNESGPSLTCRVECSPLCEINWLRNRVLINPNASLEYDISSRIVPDDTRFNSLFSVISTLIFNMTTIGEFDRYTDNAEFTCTSTANSIGPAVKSTTQFFVECK